MAEIIAMAGQGSTLNWTCLMTDDGDLYAAYVHGHLPLHDVRAIAADGMREGFAAFGYEAEVLDGYFGEGVDVWHFWMRPFGSDGTDTADQTYVDCKADEHGAFAVTGARFY